MLGLMLGLKSFVAASTALTLIAAANAGVLVKRNQEPARPPCTASFQPFSFVGCFVDTGNPKTLLYTSNLTASTMTPDKCVAFCKGNNYKYAGLEHFDQCYCGAAIGDAQGNQANCNLPCTGNNSQICGGDGYLSIYEDNTFPSVDPSSTSDYQSMGCYSEGTSGRALAWQQDQISRTSMTVEACLSACKAGNYSFAGVEYGQECYCGVTLGAGSVSLPSTSCNIVCTGNNAETCGGSSTLNLYQATDLESTQPCNGGQPPAGSSSSSSTAAASTTTTVPTTSTSTTAPASTTTTTASATTPTTTALSTTTTTAPATTSTAPVTSTTTTVSATTSTSTAPTTATTSTTMGTTTTSNIPSTTTTSTGPPTAPASTTTAPGTTTTPTAPGTTTTPATTTTCPTTSTSTTTPATTTKCPTTSTSTTIPNTPSTTPSTPTTIALCTTILTIAPAPTCEYQCGRWCSRPLPAFNDHDSCLVAVASCAIQLNSCFLNAGWPDSLNCWGFSTWCSSVSLYCRGYCPGNTCSNLGCRSRYPPSGPSLPSATVTTSVFTCTASSTSSSKPSTTTTCPVPTCANMCAQPNNLIKGYSSYLPVGNIGLPCLTCNNLLWDFNLGNCFKLYSASDTSLCPSYQRNNQIQGCRDACDNQYTSCMGVYAEECRGNNGLGRGDTYLSASIKCLNQKQDCYSTNSGMSTRNRCSSWNSGWW